MLTNQRYIDGSGLIEVPYINQANVTLVAAVGLIMISLRYDSVDTYSWRSNHQNTFRSIYIGMVSLV